MAAIDLLSPSDEHRFKAKNSNIQSAAPSFAEGFRGKDVAAQTIDSAHVQIVERPFYRKPIGKQSEFIGLGLKYMFCRKIIVNWNIFLDTVETLPKRSCKNSILGILLQELFFVVFHTR